MDSTSLSLLECASRPEDSQSWSRFVGVYSPLLRHWLNRFQIQTSDADDLIQDVLIVVARELPNFEHSQRKGSFRSWLRKILINKLRGFWRSANYRPTATGATSLQQQLNELADAASATSRLWDKEHDEFVMKRLMDQVRSRFSEQTWEAFRRQAVDGHSARKVADELEMKVNQVYLAKSRVLSALRREADGLID